MGNTIIAIAVHSLIIQLFIIQLSQSTSVLYDIVYIKVYVYIYNYMMLLAIGRTDREQIRSRINNDCRTFRPRRALLLILLRICS